MDRLSEDKRAGRAARRFNMGLGLGFASSSTASVLWGQSMHGMKDMPMPGGWTMSMIWIRMPGQTWFGAGGMFLGMWSVMMLAMMLPAAAPVLSRYHRSVGDSSHAGWLTLAVAAGYFSIWSLIGALIFPLGAASAWLLMRTPALSRAVPAGAYGVALVVGILQLSEWRARQLAKCMPECSQSSAMSLGSAWRIGMRLGARCTCCCAPSTTALLVIGVMDLRAMLLVTATQCFERILPGRRTVIRASGILTLGAILLLLNK